MVDFTNATQQPSSLQGGGQKIARQSINELYLQKMLDAVGMFGMGLSNLNGVTDLRPRLLARYCINLVLDDDIRHGLLLEFDQQTSLILKKDESNDWKAGEICKLSSDVIGEVVGYLDVFLNIHQQNYVEDV